jgi:hypothetical protein
MVFPDTGLAWWISVIEIPVVSALFWLLHATRADMEAKVAALQSQLEQRSAQLRDALSSHRLEVAKHYAQTRDVKDLEQRLISHLLRIEAKLDATALKAETATALIHLGDSQ